MTTGIATSGSTRSNPLPSPSVRPVPIPSVGSIIVPSSLMPSPRFGLYLSRAPSLWDRRFLLSVVRPPLHLCRRWPHFLTALPPYPISPPRPQKCNALASWHARPSGRSLLFLTLACPRLLPVRRHNSFLQIFALLSPHLGGRALSPF